MEQLAGTKYTIMRRLGEGGMGIVYQVVKPPNIQGVLKLMSSELTQHEDLKLRFFDEVRILAQLDHPNIVKVSDYDVLPDGTPFYVMELLHGRTVRDALATVGHMPPRIAYEIARQLLEALQCAHTHEIPVIHRDIKPDNIFLHSPKHGEPQVKLIDFGVSSVADRKHDGAFVGTWSYAAPEQIRGEAPTAQTDLYAVGLVLYEMLAGRGAFDHHPDWKMISIAQLEEIPAPVSTFAPWVPPSIVELLIASALAKDPRQRPRDAYAFAERLYELEYASDGTKPRGETVPGKGPLAAMLTSVDHARANDAPPIGVPAASVKKSGRGEVVIRSGSNPSLPDETHGPTTPRAAPVRSVNVHDTFASQHSDARRPRESHPAWPLLARDRDRPRRDGDRGDDRASWSRAGTAVHERGAAASAGTE